MKAYNLSATDAWDPVGMAASSLCIAHCVAMPAALPVLSAWGLESLADEGFHRIVVLVIVAVAALAFIPGYRKHGRSALFGFVAVGVAFLVLAAFFEGPLITQTWATAFTILGGGVMVVAHWLNHSFCKLCRACQAEQGCYATSGVG